MMVAQDLLQEQLTKALPVVSICNQQPLAVTIHVYHLFMHGCYWNIST